jgi:hypothetical protein
MYHGVQDEIRANASDPGRDRAQIRETIVRLAALGDGRDVDWSSAE